MEINLNKISWEFRARKLCRITYPVWAEKRDDSSNLLVHNPEFAHQERKKIVGILD